ncbi:MAG: response regulator transcription factor [Elusimicrobia bacterium]|nr:response regulator transcription factor [Elusimicrobiota bacterium]
MAEKILVIDDDEETAEFISEGLKLEGYTPVVASNGKDGLNKAAKEIPNLILLDLGLPDMDGLEVCKRIKQSEETRTIPVIMLTARSTTSDRVTGLEAGADDYLVKPFEPHELIARIKAIFRRVEYYAPKPNEVLNKGGIILDVGNRRVTIDFKTDVDLSPKEFQLLYLLMKNSGSVLDRDFLLKTLWGYSSSSESRTVDVHIQRLRKKILEYVQKFNEYMNDRIVTVEGFGYKFLD